MWNWKKYETEFIEFLLYEKSERELCIYYNFLFFTRALRNKSRIISSFESQQRQAAAKACWSCVQVRGAHATIKTKAKNEMNN